MDTSLLIGWQDERAELRSELSRLEEELAESRADRLELESRAQALTERVSVCVFVFVFACVWVGGGCTCAYVRVCV